MKVLHLNAGAETGGGMVHILSLLRKLNPDEMVLGVFEKGQMYYEAQKLGITVIYFGQESRYDFSILKKIAQYIQDEKIQIVHSHGPRANLFVYLLKKKYKLACKWVTTIHSDPRDDFLGKGYKGKLFTRIHLFSLKSMDHFFAISNRFKEMVVSFGIDPYKITTIYNGIDFHTPLPEPVLREHLGLTATDFVIIMVARLNPVKGHPIAFQALKKVLEKFPNVKLMLLGDGDLFEELQQLAKELAIEKNVLFLGHRENVHSYLAISDLEILTSLSESFPLVILEAARAHVPVISTDVGGVKDLISDASLGWVIPVKDEKSLKKSVEEAIMAKETGELKLIAENLYKKASTKYSLNQLCENMYETYTKLLQN
jgi:glycosyltransferase involved in cell wall biosynthesis